MSSTASRLRVLNSRRSFCCTASPSRNARQRFCWKGQTRTIEFVVTSDRLLRIPGEGGMLTQRILLPEQARTRETCRLSPFGGCRTVRQPDGGYESGTGSRQGRTQPETEGTVAAGSGAVGGGYFAQVSQCADARARDRAATHAGCGSSERKRSSRGGANRDNGCGDGALQHETGPVWSSTLPPTSSAGFWMPGLTQSTLSKDGQ